eukprot:4976746-Amphidinium_carterae.1
MIDIRHLGDYMNAMICVDPSARSWIVDSGSGEHLVGRSLLGKAETENIEEMERPVELRTANGVPPLSCPWVGWLRK